MLWTNKNTLSLNALVLGGFIFIYCMKQRGRTKAICFKSAGRLGSRGWAAPSVHLRAAEVNGASRCRFSAPWLRRSPQFIAAPKKGSLASQPRQSVGTVLRHRAAARGTPLLNTFNSRVLGWIAEPDASGSPDSDICSVLWGRSQMLREWKPIMGIARQNGKRWFMGTASDVSKPCAQLSGAVNPEMAGTIMTQDITEETSRSQVLKKEANCNWAWAPR